jgi:uncharacterized membrane protein YjjP (DUF1212 family)
MTIRAFANAQRYDWGTWMLGIFKAIMVGLGAALVTLGSSSFAGLNQRQTWTMVIALFLTQAGIRLGEFLTLHGAPDQLQVTLDAAAVSAAKTVDAVAKAQDIAPEATKAKL